MNTVPSSSVLFYQEKGPCQFAQTLARPVSLLFGRSFDKAGKEFEPKLLEKITAVVLTILLLPLAIPAISIGLLALALSPSHKAEYNLVFAFPLAKKRVEQLLKYENLPAETRKKIDPAQFEQERKNFIEKAQNLEDLLEILQRIKINAESHEWPPYTALNAYIDELQEVIKSCDQRLKRQIKEHLRAMKEAFESANRAEGGEPTAIRHLITVCEKDISGLDNETISSALVILRLIAEDHRAHLKRPHEAAERYLRRFGIVVKDPPEYAG